MILVESMAPGEQSAALRYTSRESRRSWSHFDHDMSMSNCWTMNWFSRAFAMKPSSMKVHCSPVVGLRHVFY